MEPEQTTADFVFKIEGSIGGQRISPRNTPVEDLAEIITRLVQTIRATASTRADHEQNSVISLVQLEDASNSLVFTVSLSIASAITTISHAVAEDASHELPHAAQVGLAKVAKKLADRQLNGTFISRTESLDIANASIGSSNLIAPPIEPRSVRGQTTLFARCYRVGGKEPKAMVELSTGEYLAIDLSRELAKQLAGSLYEDVVLHGVADFETASGRILEFKLEDISPFRSRDVSGAFASLAAMCSDEWDGIDAVEYVKNLRK